MIPFYQILPDQPRLHGSMHIICFVSPMPRSAIRIDLFGLSTAGFDLPSLDAPAFQLPLVVWGNTFCHQKYPRHALLYYSTLQTSPNYLSKPQSPDPGQVPPVNALSMRHSVARSPLQRVLLEMYSACSQRTFSESSRPMSLVLACQSFLFLEHLANNE